MHSSLSFLFVVAVASVLFFYSCTAEQYLDEEPVFDKRSTSMRNALVRFGRSTGMRNALVRFGKRSDFPDYGMEAKRNGAPEPFVRFGRSSGRPTSIHDLFEMMQKYDN